MKKTIPGSILEFPKSYTSLFEMHAPRPIHGKADYERTVGFIDLMAGHSLSADQADYLDALSVMVERYEEERVKARLSGVSPIDAVRHLVEENGVSVTELGRVVGSQPLASLILAGKRAISRDVALRLAARFFVSPALFLEQAGRRRKTAWFPGEEFSVMTVVFRTIFHPCRGEPNSLGVHVPTTAPEYGLVMG